MKSPKLTMIFSICFCFSFCQLTFSRVDGTEEHSARISRPRVAFSALPCRYGPCFAFFVASKTVCCSCPLGASVGPAKCRLFRNYGRISTGLLSASLFARPLSLFVTPVCSLVSVMEGDSTVRNADHGASGLTVRRKRGRPRKSDTVLLPGEIKALGIMPDSEAKFKKQRPAEADGLHVPQGSTSLIGQTVHGVIDGSFDAGFLVTVRLENEDSIYRGVIFGPGLSLPLSKITDIAPNVKVANRDETLSVFHPENTSAPLSETYALEPLTKPTPSETGIIPENVSRDQQHQDMVETSRHGIE